jgi:hypothetical protein
MSFATDDLQRLAAAEEVEIETQAPDGSVHRTIIWVVVDDSEVFVRSVNGRPARWFREASANPGVALHLDGRRLPVTAIPATDPDSIERISAALRAKYAQDRTSLEAMLEPGMLDANFRLEPI